MRQNRDLRATAAAALILAGLAAPALAQAQPSPCGPQTVVRASDTLSAIAQRCDVSEGAILAGNRQIDGSDDLVVGETIALPDGKGGTLDRLGTIAGEATEELGAKVRETGSAIGRSVEGFLSDNPAIGQRLRDLTGSDASAIEVRVISEPAEAGGASSLRLEASGLPADEAVIVTAGPPGTAQARIAEATTDGNGALSLALPPTATTGQDELRLSIRSRDGDWKATAATKP